MEQVAAFTDTYLPTVNGVSYTIKTWRERWQSRGGRMEVVFPSAPDYSPADGEHPVRSFRFPFYDGFRIGLPGIPEAVRDVDLVHAHTPFALGLSGLHMARQRNLPLVASYHTPTAEYADYLANGSFSTVIEGTARRYERWYLNRADVLVVPSGPAGDHLRDIGVETPTHVVPNGVDTDFFSPAGEQELTRFRDRHDLPEGPLVGYTGRHGFEKNLDSIVPAVVQADVEVTLLFGGDGPARDKLEAQASEADVATRFLGFLEREELPALYTSLDAFLFPSPVETQGLVALEANACGTPVVGVNAGALAETIVEGETGYRFERGDTRSFAHAIERTFAERKQLREACLARRDQTSVEAAIDCLTDVYAEISSCTTP